MSPDSILVKLNLSNAFNRLHRDSTLVSVNEVMPELAAYCHLANPDIHTIRQFHRTIAGRCTARRPLGPLLFCLPLQSILTQLESPLTFGYLDDLTLGGPPDGVVADIDLIESGCAQLGCYDIPND